MSPPGPARRRLKLAAALASLAVGLATAAVAPSAASAGTGSRVLLVGSFHGIPGQFHSIQTAVNAARPGDWVLVGPGDYKEHGSLDPEYPAGVLIETPDLHLRGMDRNTVIVDGTRTGSKPCDSSAAAQFDGPKDSKGKPIGMNGVEVWKASGGSVENLTVCNYLTSPSGGNGNEIWWNGGDGSGKIGLGSFRGAYLTATSEYSKGLGDPKGEYGIFASNARGPGLIEHTYASNMGDAAYYVGACRQVCNTVITDGHAQNNALGYSGTNSGGNLIIENSEFDHNKTGITTDSENNDDYPSPQNGACPGNAKGPTGTQSCEIWRNNYIHDNNNPNVPGVGSGLAGEAPVGTGIVIAGGENDTLLHNRIVHNGAWGVFITDVPYQGTPPSSGATCQGGIPGPDYQACYYESFGDETAGNSFAHNGFFGNPTNGDIALLALPHDPGNCFHGNTDPGGLTSDPPNIQGPPWDTCGQPNAGDEGPLLVEALCVTQLLFPCPTFPEATYPRPTHLTLMPIPREPTMPNPCAGVPANPWCPGGRPAPAGGTSSTAADRPRRT